LTKPTIFFAMVYSLRVITPWLGGLGSPGLTARLLETRASWETRVLIS
jgi:hypothetical protein